MSYSIVHRYEKHGQLNEALSELSKTDTDPFTQLLKANILQFLGNKIEAIELLENLILDSNNDPNGEIAIVAKIINCEILVSQLKLESIPNQIKYLKQKVSQAKFISLDPEYWEGKILQVEGAYLTKKFQHKIALKTLEASKNIFEKIDNDREIANSLHSIGIINENQGKLDGALKYYEMSLNIRSKLENKYDLANSYNRIGVIYGKKSKFNDAKKYFDLSLNCGLEVGYNVELARIYTNLGVISKMKGELSSAEEWYSKALTISKKLNDEISISKIYINIGNIQMSKGGLDEAIITYNEVLPLLEKLENLTDKAALLVNLGIIFKRKGEFSNAIKHYKESIEIEMQLGNEKNIAPALHNIGVISVLQGNLSNALENFQKALTIWESLDNFVDKATALQYIGLIYLEKDMAPESLNYLKEALILRKKLNNDISTSESLYYLILAEMEINNNKDAEKHYNDLVKINKKTKNKVIKTRTRLAQAIMLQKDTRINKIVEAQELFEEVLSEDLIDNELTIFAMLKLCEFLLLELKVSGEKEVLIEIKTLLEKLYEMAQEQESHTLLIEILIIQSQLALVDYNIKETKEFLQHASEIAEEKELTQYKLKISYLLDSVEKDVIKYANIASTIPINERINQLEIESYLKEVADHKDLNSFNPEMFKTGLKKNLQMHLNFANLLLMDKTLPEEMKKYVHFIELSAKEIQFAISTLLMIEKLEAGTYHHNYEDFNLDEVIQLRINHYEEKVNAKSLVVDFKKSNGISTVRSDQYLLSRILDHLIDNTIKFSTKKSTINLKLETDENSRTITIENECETIPEHDQSNLFDKYTQYLIHESTRKHGVGLGLAFCDLALKSIQGNIQFMSPSPSKESGVTVIFKIPKEI